MLTVICWGVGQENYITLNSGEEKYPYAHGDIGYHIWSSHKHSYKANHIK